MPYDSSPEVVIVTEASRVTEPPAPARPPRAPGMFTPQPSPPSPPSPPTLVTTMPGSLSETVSMSPQLSSTTSLTVGPSPPCPPALGDLPTVAQPRRGTQTLTPPPPLPPPPVPPRRQRL